MPQARVHICLQQKATMNIVIFSIISNPYSGKDDFNTVINEILQVRIELNQRNGVKLAYECYAELLPASFIPNFQRN